MSTHAVAVIGTGNMGTQHANAYRGHDDCDLLACADVVPELAAEFADEFGIADDRVYEDHVTMLREESLDLVSVCTPIPTHGDVAIDCLKAGDLDGVHCEKPMADTWGECRLLAQEADRRGVQLTFNHQLRCSEPVERAKALLDGGAIGELERVEASRGDVYEAGTHHVDLCSHFAGDVPGEWVLGGIDYREEESRNGVHIEDQALGLWAYENGVHGLASTGDGSDAIGCHNRLRGSDGVVEIAFWDDDPVRVRRAGGEWEAVDCELGSPLPRAIEHVIECLESGTEPILGARNALVGTELIYGIWESTRRRGRVDLPLTIDDNPVRAMIEAGDLNPS